MNKKIFGMDFDLATHQKRLKIADSISRASPDPSSKIGCVIFSEFGMEVGRGCNSFPTRSCADVSVYDNRPAKYDRIIHAEMRAIILAGKLACTRASLYTGCPPCKECAKGIAEAGITTVYFWSSRMQHSFVQRYPENIDTAMTIFAECGVKVQEIEDGI